MNPANGQYVFGSPAIDKARISLPGGKEFTISIKDNKPENTFIQGMKLNGKSYTKAYLLHKDLVKGGKLEVTMGAKPSKTWGIQASDLPFSEPK